VPCVEATPFDVLRRATEDNDLSLSTSVADAAQPNAALMSGKTQANSESILATIMASLEADKGEDIVKINLRGKSEMGDYMVIATGRSTRQVSAMAEKLADKVKSEFGVLSKMEGREVGDWVLIDTGDVIVHIFRPEVREFYQLEKMWVPSAATAE
jgi:ribosome-associated protein